MRSKLFQFLPHKRKKNMTLKINLAQFDRDI